MFISRHVFDEDHFLFSFSSTPSDSLASDRVTTILPIIRSSPSSPPSSDVASLTPTSVFPSDSNPNMLDPILTPDADNASPCAHISSDPFSPPLQVPVPLDPLPLQPINTYSMVTRPKVDIFKLKLLMVNLLIMNLVLLTKPL